MSITTKQIAYIALSSNMSVETLTEMFSNESYRPICDMLIAKFPYDANKGIIEDMLVQLEHSNTNNSYLVSYDSIGGAWIVRTILPSKQRKNIELLNGSYSFKYNNADYVLLIAGNDLAINGNGLSFVGNSLTSVVKQLVKHITKNDNASVSGVKFFDDRKVKCYKEVE